jgi:hypothetical protein
MLNCREVVQIVSTANLEKTAWRTKLSIWLHLAMCRHCRRFASQIRLIGETARKLWSPSTDDLAAMERIRKKLG